MAKRSACLCLGVSLSLVNDFDNPALLLCLTLLTLGLLCSPDLLLVSGSAATVTSSLLLLLLFLSLRRCKIPRPVTRRIRHDTVMVTPIMIGCLSCSSSCGDTSVMIPTASRRESPDLLGRTAAGDLVGIRVSSLITTDVILRLGVVKVEELE